MTPQDRAALVALVATWRERPAPDKAVQLAYARCADALEAALAALPSGGAEGEPSEARRASDVCECGHIRDFHDLAPSGGCDTHDDGPCACCRFTPQPSAPAAVPTHVCTKCGRSTTLDPHVQSFCECGYAWVPYAPEPADSDRILAPAAVLPEPVDVDVDVDVEAMPRSSLAIAIVDLLALLPQSMRNLGMAADMERALKSHMRRVQPQPFDAKTDTDLLQKARQFAAESNICLTVDLVEALVGFVRKAHGVKP